MKPNSEIEEKGLKAYEQARAYERMRSWRLQVWFSALPVLGLVSGIVCWRSNLEVLAWVNFIGAAFTAWAGRFQWKQLAIRHARNQRLLKQLKDEYGDELPWVQVEKHFAELEQIKREMAEERK